MVIEILFDEFGSYKVCYKWFFMIKNGIMIKFG